MVAARSVVACLREQTEEPMAEDQYVHPGPDQAAEYLFRVTGETELPLRVCAWRLRRFGWSIPSHYPLTRLLGHETTGSAEVMDLLHRPQRVLWAERERSLTLARVTRETGPLLAVAEHMLAGDTSMQNWNRDLRELPEAVEALGEAAAPLRPRLRELCALEAPLTSFAPDGWNGSDRRIRDDEQVRADLTALLDAAEG